MEHITSFPERCEQVTNLGKKALYVEERLEQTDLQQQGHGYELKRAFQGSPINAFTRRDVMRMTGLAHSPASALIRKMKDAALIERVDRAGRGCSAFERQMTATMR